METLRQRLRMFMGQYNESIRGIGLDLVFFEDAIINLVKVYGTYMFNTLRRRDFFQ